MNTAYMNNPVLFTGIGRSTRVHTRFDWTMFAALLGLLAFSLMAIYSSTQRMYGTGYVSRQAVAAGIGLLGLVIIASIPYQIWDSITYYLYAFGLGFLILVLVAGTTMRGTRGWFDLKIFYIQPSEFVKPCVVLTLAAYMRKRFNRMGGLASLVAPCVMVALPVVLIVLEPDLSSALVMLPVLLIMLFVAGARPVYLAGAVGYLCLSGGVPLILTFLKLKYGDGSSSLAAFFIKILGGGWSGLIVLAIICIFIYAGWLLLRQLRVFVPVYVLLGLVGVLIGGAVTSQIIGRVMKDYQRKRFIAFIDPKIDPLGSGYNIRQSIIAVGSGELFGKGYKSGTQSRLGFLPERHTDFIFAVIGEEFGFFRSLAVLFLYCLVVWRCFAVAGASRDSFGSLISCGIGALVAFGGVANLGMVTGIFPVAGIPLPFLSYGGSAVVANLCMMGLVFSVSARR